MGQKVNPTGIRLGIVGESESNWYAGKEFPDNLLADLAVRDYLNKTLADAGIARIQIERPAKSANITIYAARPGIIIGQKGRSAEVLRQHVAKIMNVPVHINIEEIKKPETRSKLVAQGIAEQLERRVMFRRAMKRAAAAAMRAGVLGIKICVSGRLGGAEIARAEWTRDGRVPLHTFRADIDYATAEAKTTYGIIGVKVWIFKGEIHSKKKVAKKVTVTDETTE